MVRAVRIVIPREESRGSRAEAALPVGRPVPGWTPRPRPERTPLDGRYCRVEPLDAPAHAEALFEAYGLAADGSDWTYLPYGPFDAVGELRDWLAAMAAADDPLFYTIVDEVGRPAGVASYLRINPTMGSIEVGHIHYSPHLQRTRAATEAMYLMLCYAFDQLGYRRYEWKCDALHAGSRRSAERLGFTYEGTHRQAVVYKGRNRDTAWYSILDSEWPRVRSALEAWLEPENFDPAGAQRGPLRAGA